VDLDRLKKHSVLEGLTERRFQWANLKVYISVEGTDEQRETIENKPVLMN
jgi:hypothetical protein